jgi:hypothetical protein
MWLLSWLAPDHKTIADFRKDNGLALCKVCARFIELCRDMGLLTTTSVAIDGSEFKAVNYRDKDFTSAKVVRAGWRPLRRSAWSSERRGTILHVGHHDLLKGSGSGSRRWWRRLW